MRLKGETDVGTLDPDDSTLLAQRIADLLRFRAGIGPNGQVFTPRAGGGISPLDLKGAIEIAPVNMASEPRGIRGNTQKSDLFTSTANFASFPDARCPKALSWALTQTRSLLAYALWAEFSRLGSLVLGEQGVLRRRTALVAPSSSRLRQ